MDSLIAAPRHRVGRSTEERVGMAIGIRIKFPGVTQEQFDEVNKHVDPASNPPTGLLFHASGPIDGGWGVIDFWESRDAFEAFFGERVQKAVAASGVEMQGAPDIKEFAVHEMYKG
jgi:quinol monooxygenase YgiN